MTVEETPQHGDRKALAAIGDQPLLDLEQRDIRRAPDQAQEIVPVRLDPAGAAVAARWRRRNLARGCEPHHPAHRARYAHFEMCGRLIARQPAQDNRLNHALAKIVGKSHPRRPLRGVNAESETNLIREFGGLCEVADARVGRHEWRPHISRIERCRRSMRAARGVSDEMLDGQVRLGGTFRHFGPMEISQFLLTAITETYPNIVTIDPLCILVPFAMGRVVCHICRPAEPYRTASPSTGRCGNLWPLPGLPTRNHSMRNWAQRQAPKKGAFSMTRERLVCLRTPVSHQRRLRRRSADEVGFVQSPNQFSPFGYRSKMDHPGMIEQAGRDFCR